jgi:hypothetical protein
VVDRGVDRVAELSIRIPIREEIAPWSRWEVVE